MKKVAMYSIDELFGKLGGGITKSELTKTLFDYAPYLQKFVCVTPEYLLIREPYLTERCRHIAWMLISFMTIYNFLPKEFIVYNTKNLEKVEVAYESV